MPLNLLGEGEKRVAHDLGGEGKELLSLLS